jgi:hypothetical protein
MPEVCLPALQRPRRKRSVDTLCGQVQGIIRANVLTNVCTCTSVRTSTHARTYPTPCAHTTQYNHVHYTVRSISPTVFDDRLKGVPDTSIYTHTHQLCAPARTPFFMSVQAHRGCRWRTCGLCAMRRTRCPCCSETLKWCNSRSRSWTPSDCTTTWLLEPTPAWTSWLGCR